MEKEEVDSKKEEVDLSRRLEELKGSYEKNLFSKPSFDTSQEEKEELEVSEKREEIKPDQVPETSKEYSDFKFTNRPEQKAKEKQKRPEKQEAMSVFKISKKNKQVPERAVKDNRPSDKEVKEIAEIILKMKKEMSKILVGQEHIVDGLIRALICDGHVLLEGIPGIAKTLAIRALGAVNGCDVKRVQFTVDLLPTDIIGLTSYTPQKGFEVIKGPIFANFLIADEINRSPPKTQSALIEGMQEKQVTIGRKGYKLPDPFFVMATENPLETAGVYPLPEAQIDRFLFKIIMGYPREEEERDIMETNMTLKKFEDFNLQPVTSPREIVRMQNVVKRIYLSDNIKSYILSLVKKTRNKNFTDSEYLSYGVSPRASIALFIAGKAHALMEGRNFVIPEDIKAVIFDVMRHRLILSYKATLRKVSPDDLIRNILNETKVL